MTRERDGETQLGGGVGREMSRGGVGRDTIRGWGGERNVKGEGWGEKCQGGGVGREMSRGRGGEKNVKGEGREQVGETYALDDYCVCPVVHCCVSCTSEGQIHTETHYLTSLLDMNTLVHSPHIVCNPHTLFANVFLSTTNHVVHALPHSHTH